MPEAKGRMQHMCIIVKPRAGWPRQPIGVYDIADMLGASIHTSKRALKEGELYGIELRDLGRLPVDKKRTCIRCGKIVGDERCSSYCNTCRAENRKAGQERLQKRRSQGNQTQEVKARHEVPYEQKSKLARVAWDARQMGLSYGQYMTAQTARWGICQKKNS